MLDDHSKLLFDDDELIPSLCSYEVFVDQLNQTCSNIKNSNYGGPCLIMVIFETKFLSLVKH